MDVVKKAAGHICAVMKGMIFIGFSIQIAWGVVWMCCNFGCVQDFGEPEGALYGRLFRLLGGIPQVMYLLQILAAFFTGYHFLQKLRPVGKLLAVWRGLALLTVPFAMQCHLAVQPYSVMGSLFLLLLLALLTVRRGKAVRNLALAAVCTAGMLVLSGAGDGDRRGEPGHSLEGAMASRFAWPTVWNDLERYPEDLREMTEEVAWEASIAPGNMELFYQALESRAGEERARPYYLQMVKVAWEYHAPMVVRQIGWDVLGYAVSPVIFQIQMSGKAYASYSGRNYEVMRSWAPVVTRNYVDYGCWWFGSAVILAAFMSVMGLFGGDTGNPGGKAGQDGVKGQSGRQKENADNWEGSIQPSSPGDMADGKISGKRLAAFSGICICVSGILIALLALRGAGQMDYRAAIAINELWLCWPLSALGGGRREGI